MSDSDPIPPGVRAYEAEDPELFRRYREHRTWVMHDGALSRKDKMLIALGAVTALAEPDAIRVYADSCVKEGATRAEILEACHVGTLFSGGAGVMAAGRGLH